MRIGQRPLKSVILFEQYSTKVALLRIQHLKTTGIMRIQVFSPKNQEKRSAPLGTCFGERQRAAGEVERCKTDFPGELSAGIFPVQSAGNHQVEDKKRVRFK